MKSSEKEQTKPAYNTNYKPYKKGLLHQTISNLKSWLFGGLVMIIITVVAGLLNGELISGGLIYFAAWVAALMFFMVGVEYYLNRKKQAQDEDLYD